MKRLIFFLSLMIMLGVASSIEATIIDDVGIHIVDQPCVDVGNVGIVNDVATAVSFDMALYPPVDINGVIKIEANNLTMTESKCITYDYYKCIINKSQVEHVSNLYKVGKIPQFKE